jgi:PKD repeat protein
MSDRPFTLSRPVGTSGLASLRHSLWRSKVFIATAAIAMIASTMSVLPTTSAMAADPPPPDPQTVSADVLPTPQINGVVWRVAVAGDVAYAVGSFTKARPAGSPAGTNEVTRNNAMAFNITTGAILAWNPNLNAQGRAVQISPDGTKLYVGGDFTTVSGQAQSKVAAFSLPSGAYDASYKTGASGAVRALAISNDRVFVGGSFSGAGGQPRSNLAAFDRTTGALLPWAPTADSIVEALVTAPDNSRVILGGRFQNVNGVAKVGVGAVSGTTGASLTWTSRPVPTTINSGATSWVTDLVMKDGVVYGTANGEGGHWYDGRFAATFSNGDLIWLDNCYGATYGTAIIDQVMYTVSHSHDCTSLGTFSDSNPQVWHRALAETIYATGTDQSAPGSNSNYSHQPIPTQLNWYPPVNAGTYTGIFQGGWGLGTNGTYLVMGGEFTQVNGKSQQGLATFVKRTIAPNKIGPVYSTDTKPSVRSLSSGTARIAFTGTSDYDDATLTYQVLRDNSLTPIYSTDIKSPFWALPQSGFVDTGLAPGSTHTYRINIKDPWGNSYIGPRSDAVVISSTTPSAYAQGIVADGASTYWPLNEPSGTIVYDNAGFNDADAGSGVTRGASGAIPGDAASSFDGTSNGLVSTRAAVQAPDVFTVEAWINTRTRSGGKILGFGNTRTGNSGNYDRHLYMDNNGRITFGVYPGGVATIESSPGYNDGQWHLITASLGTDGMKLSIDGVRVAQRTDVVFGQAYNGYWRVGGDNLNGWPNRGSSDYFAGAVDDVAIYPTVLSRTTVLNHYTASGRTSSAPPAPTDAYGQAVYQDDPDLFWRLNDQSGQTAQDASPSSNPGMISGTVAFGGSTALDNGTSFGFNGSNSLVAATKSASNPLVYSLETWFKTTTNVGGKLIGFGNAQTGTSSAYDRHVYMQDDGRLVFGTYTGQLNTATSPNAYNDGQWHYLVATQSSNGLQLYVDAALVATNPQTSAQNYTGYWRIGGDNTWGSSSPYFNGQLDEAAVYSSALSGARIKAHYEAVVGAIPNTAPHAAFTETGDDLTAAFDATSSYDPDGQISGYSWTFGDGATGSGSTVSHTYAAGGQYTVALTVTDDEGATNTASQSVTVLNPPTAPTDAYGKAVTGAGANTYWRLDESGGTLAQDSSLSDNPGTISGGVTYGVTGVPADTGHAMQFNGSDGMVVSRNAVTDPRNFSLETWFKTTTDQGGKLIGFGNEQTGTSSNYDRHVYMNRNGTLAFGVWTGQANLVTSAASYNDGLWHHLVATQSTTDGLNLYIDGASVGTNPQTDAQVYTGYWRVGGDTNWGDGGAYFNGALDEVAVYPSVLSSQTVADHYSLGSTGAVPNQAPTASFSSVMDHLTGTFDASASSDPDGSISSYAWNFGDSQTGTGATASHVYSSAGTYTVTLTVTDNSGDTGTHSASVTATAPPANQAPVAAFSSSVANLVASFNGSGSTDPDGTIASYAWNFGDSGTGTGASPNHTYAAAGTYQVNLTVTDNQGATGTVSHPVTVSASPPATAYATDSFERTLATGFGTADTGGAWTTSNSSSYFSVGGGVGQIHMTTGRGPSIYLNSVSSTNTEVSVSVGVDKVSTGGGVTASVVGRGNSSGDYRAQLKFLANGTVTVALQKAASNGAVTTLGTESVITGLTYAVGDSLTIRLQVVGVSPTTLNLKVWKTGTSEPAAWTKTTTDATDGLQAAGRIGLFSYLSASATNPPTATLWDNLWVGAPVAG